MENRSVKYIVKPEIGLVVCVIKEDWNNVFRGVAKCSPEDQFDEEKGKRIAYLRACKKRKRAFIKDCRGDIEMYREEIRWWEEKIAQHQRKLDKMLKSVALYSEEIDSIA